MTARNSHPSRTGRSRPVPPGIAAVIATIFSSWLASAISASAKTF
jgi:hypothetical protein